MHPDVVDPFINDIDLLCHAFTSAWSLLPVTKYLFLAKVRE